MGQRPEWDVIVKRQFAKYALLSCVVAGCWALACSPDAPGVFPAPPAAPPPPPLPPPPSGNRPPTANITAPATANEGWNVVFRADSSADPDGDALTFAWSFGDGSTLATSADTAVHRYRDNGTYNARLIVKDARGAADTATARVSVANVAPEISISKFPEPVLPVGMVFEAEVVFWESETDDALQGGISWGDGTSTALTSSGALVTHSYSSIGTYSINVWARDKDGATTAALGPQMKIFDGHDVVDLGTLGGVSSRAYALNDNGQVVGTSQIASGEWHAFVWENGVMRDLGVPYQSKAQAITNSGVISGVSTQGGAAYTHVFRWEGGSLQDLGTVYELNGDDAQVVGMTGRDVLATYETSMSRFYSTFWRNGAKQNLGGLESPNSTALATAMNSQGQIVGAPPDHVTPAVYVRGPGVPAISPWCLRAFEVGQHV